MQSVRVAEVLSALALTTDLTAGVPFEKGLATCAVASAFGRVLGLGRDDRRAVYDAGLLRAVGCTSHASENAALFGDDIAFQAAHVVLDPGDPDVFQSQIATFGSWAGPDARDGLARLFLEEAPTAGPRAALGACEVSRALGPRLGLGDQAVTALDDVYERWDGLGIPAGRKGEALSLVGRVVHVAEQAVIAHASGGRDAAVAEVGRRAGGHLDPDLCARFVAGADAVLAPLGSPDLLAEVVTMEPHPVRTVGSGEIDRLCLALAIVVDLKGRFLLGHSAHVAQLADQAGALTGVDGPARGQLRAAALLHDLGRACVPSSIWDRAGPLSAADWERVRLHPYWTGRVLQRCPALAPLAPIAAGHHERHDGSGYPRGIRSAELPVAARLLAAADVFAAATEPRPHRPALTPQAAAGVLRGEADAGRLDREACAAVVEAAGLPRPRPAWPCDLTDREVDVLRLVTRGSRNREIATQLVISERTVHHHLAHIYDKIGRRTRAGAAVFAMEHGLLPTP